MKLLIIGSYNEEYQRNKVLISALEDCFDVSKVNCNSGKYKRYWTFLKYFFFHGKKYDYIFLMQPAQKFVFVLVLSRLFYRSKIVFDAFTSIYDTYVNDRKLTSKYSLKAVYYYLLDFLMVRLSDVIIFDTEGHKNYFSLKFKISKSKKKLVLLVSIDLDVIDRVESRQEDNREFTVLFYGYFIPLQGVEYIIEAAKILKNEKIKFKIIGSGQTKKEIIEKSKEHNLQNVLFVDRISYEELIGEIKSAEVCLGIFGSTEKAKRVIPNKLLESMACGKIVITGKNKEMENYFNNNEDLVYCNMADGEDLARKIVDVQKKYEELKHIKKNARKKIEKFFSKESLSETIKKQL